jgi:hypothetical protein
MSSAAVLAATVRVGGSALRSFGMVAVAVGLFATAGASAAHTSMAGMGTTDVKLSTIVLLAQTLRVKPADLLTQPLDLERRLERARRRRAR